MYMEKAPTLGLTDLNTKGNGRITRCMVKGFFHGKVVVNGMVNGLMVICMARDSILIQKGSGVVNGKMENKLDGLKSEQLFYFK